MAREMLTVGVIGAGTMGAGIAQVCLQAGHEVLLHDVDQAAIERGRGRIADGLARLVEKGRLTTATRDSLLANLRDAPSLEGLAQESDLVIEAALEDLDLKRTIFRALGASAPSTAILATNTSALSVSEIGQSSGHPERVVGLHFFNPVQRMPLVEIVRGKATSDAVVAATAALALALSKTPVVVADVAGFLVNRLLGPYLDEAARLLEAGVPPQSVERAAVAFGMPMGPLELIDEVGLDIAAHAAAALFSAYGERMRPSPLLQRLLAAGLTGRKGGGGFYAWRADRKRGRSVKAGLHPELSAALGAAPRAPLALRDDELTDRLVLALLAEAWRCLEERVVDGPRTIDLATVFGMGFPPFRGGALRYAQTRGADDVLAGLRRVAASPDVVARGAAAARFDPPASLVAAAGQRTQGTAP